MTPVDFREIASIEAQHRFYVELIAPKLGERILDAGCGRGVTLDLALAARPDSLWYGCDINPQALSQARSPISKSLRLCAADLRALPYRNGSFDAVFSRDTLECIPEPMEALVEISRVLKSGGRLVVSHWDWYSQYYAIADLDIARRMCDSFAETQQGWMEFFDPSMGRKLNALVQEAPDLRLTDAGGLRLVETEWTRGKFGHEQSLAITSLLRGRNKISPTDSAEWLQGLERAAQERSYRYSIDHYWVAARKR